MMFFNVAPINKIDKILNKFLAPFECKACVSGDFCYFPSKNLIGYSFVVTDNNAKYYTEFIHEIAPELNCDIFLMSLMHELGHSETIDDLTDEEYNYCQDVKQELNKKEHLEKEDHFMYFNLPDERMATEWGVNYMLFHQEEITELWSKLQPVIIELYKTNYIDF